MRRREFMTLLGGAAMTLPLVANAGDPAVPVIGFLSSRAPADSQHLVAAFRQSLSDIGYVERQNVAIEFRWAEGAYDRLPSLAAGLVHDRIAVLVAVGGEPSALAAKAATSSIPIVFSVGGDPVKSGLVVSLNRPGGNATGASLLTSPVDGKRLELLHEIVPNAAAISVLLNPNYQQAEAQAKELQAAAGTIGRPIDILNASNETELKSAFATPVQRRAEALLVGSDPFFDTRRDLIIAFAAQHRVPAIYQFREYAVAGGLMSYGISLTDGYRWVGSYAGQILKGAKPADLPVLRSVKFELVINLKTARTLGLDVPPTLLAGADEVIE